MVVVAISAILAAVAVPQYTQFIGSRTISAQASALSASLRLARSEALKRNLRVTICPSNNPEAAAPACNPADPVLGWGRGWLIFTDLGVQGQIGPNDTVIRVQPGFPGSGGMMPPSAAYTISFAANGITVGGFGGTFTLKNKADPTSTSSSRCLIVTAQGTSRLTRC